MEKIKYFREKTIIGILLLIFIILAGAHKYVSSYYNEDKGFEWRSWAKTSDNLSVMFAKCSLYHTGYHEKNCIQNVMLYGDDSNAVISCGSTGIEIRNELYPDSLKILYYSFNENKFFGGNFRLDYEKIQAIAEKMRNAVEEGNSKGIYFETKVYPMGKVIVSMESSSIGKKIIASFQAKQENHDWSVFENESSTRERRVSKSKSIAVQRALLLNKYNWQVNLILPKDCIISNLDVDVYGNRGLRMDTIKNATVPTFTNFVYLPQGLHLDWKRKDTIKFGTEFYFDEKEIIKAFETINKGNNNFPISMRLIVKNDTTALRAILIGNGKSIELKNIEDSKIWNYKIYN